MNGPLTLSSEGHLQRSTVELNKYLALQIDWVAEAKAQKAEPEVIELIRLKPNPSRIAQHVDPLIVWKRIEGNFPVIKRIARRVLATPASNAFQEGVFSAASYISNPYRRAMSAQSLEKNVLLKVNSKFINSALSNEKTFAASLRDEQRMKIMLGAVYDAHADEIKAVAGKKARQTELEVKSTSTKRPRTVHLLD